jgi:glyoxylase I family protein
MYRFHHVAISVGDLARSIDFYAQLGFKQAGRWKQEDGSLEIVDLKNGAMLLEIFLSKGAQELPEHSKDIEKDIAVRGTKHFALRVTSIMEAKADLLSKGIEIAFEAISDDPASASYLFVRDPDGILVEIIEDRRGY